MSRIQQIKEKAKKDKSLIIKLLYTSGTRGLAAIGTFVFNFVLAKFLGVSDFGYFMLAYSILIGLGFIVRFGFSSAIMRFGAIMFKNKQFGQLDKMKRDVFYLTFAASVFFGLLLILFRPYLIERFFEGADISKMLLIFAFSLPFYSYLTIQSSYLKAFEKPQLAPFFEVGLVSFLTGFFIFLLAIFGLKIDGSLVSLMFLSSSVIVYFMGYYTVNKIIKNEKGQTVYNFEKYTGFFEVLPDYAFSAITSYLLKFSPTIILGIYASGKDVGLYSLANSITFVINFVLWIVNTVYAPHFANLYNQNKIKELSSMVKMSIVYMSVIAIPLFLIIFIFPSTILSIFGNDFKAAKYGLMIMAVAQLINTLTGPVYFLLNMTGYQRKLRNIVLLTAILSIGSSFSLIPYYGYFGAIISTTIGLLFQNILSFYHVRKHVGIKFF